MSSQSIKLYKQLAKSKIVKNIINFDLTRIKMVLFKLGNPEKKLRNVINVIGSDGKYSLLTSLKYFLEANNYRVSSYTSPSLRTIRERFWMGNNFLSYKNISKTLKLIEKQNIKLTVFEVLTVIFIINAAEENNDYNLIEAGALFAKDSTNIFSFPLMQVIVNINKQHLNFVKKKTIDEIIKQKVAFLSNFSRIYIGKQSSKNLKTIKYYLRGNTSEINYPNKWNVKIKSKRLIYSDKINKINLDKSNINTFGLKNNLALAIKIALDLGISKEIIIKTIPKIKLQARAEYITQGKLIKKIHKNEKILIDGCHSFVSGKNLANFLRGINVKKIGIWSMSKNKNPEEFIKNFKNIFDKLFIIPLIDGSNIATSELYYAAKKYNFKAKVVKDINSAVEESSNKEKKIICVFGSLYLCGDFLKIN